MFELLQCCNSQEVAVTCQEITSRDHVTGSDPEVRHLTGSILEVDLKGL